MGNVCILNLMSILISITAKVLAFALFGVKRDLREKCQKKKMSGKHLRIFAHLVKLCTFTVSTAAAAAARYSPPPQTSRPSRGWP